jgi:pSer/pThr/pTyr-binding forkhead associated (FHA) protein
VKSTRAVALADHLWDLFGRMAEEMGSDREALVNEAMHVFARQHGYLPPVPGEPRDEPPGAAQAQADAEGAAPAREAPPPIPSGVVAPGARDLFLLRDDGSEVRVGEGRFLIGRGRHCQLVIDGAKVSREHAAIFRDGDGWFIEDLQSANGTWHRQVRIDRRPIADGDEYFVCADRLRCQLR